MPDLFHLILYSQFISINLMLQINLSLWQCKAKFLTQLTNLTFLLLSAPQVAQSSNFLSSLLLSLTVVTFPPVQYCLMHWSSVISPVSLPLPIWTQPQICLSKLLSLLSSSSENTNLY